MKQSKNKSPLRLANKVFIRGVTNYYTGKIVALTTNEIVLSDAAWVADTGRFSSALESGIFAELEPYPGLVSVNRGSICDVTDWPHALPRVAK